MAAFTEGFTDTTKPGKDHIGSMISKVLAARKMAREERELAEAKAKKAGYDSLEEVGVEKGFFFKAALKNKFGGSYISGKKQDIQQAVDRVKLLKNPKAQFWNFVDNRDAEGNEIKKKSNLERFREQFDNYNFQSAQRPPEGVKAETPAIPKKMSPFEVEQQRKALTEERMLAQVEEKVAAAASGGGKQRASREDLLQAINAIAQSLDKTAQSINNSIGDSKQIASDVHAMKTDVVNQISERTDGIEDKLTKIAEAINAQTALKKKSADDAETSAAIGVQKDVNDVARDITFDDTTTDIDESALDTDQLDYKPGRPDAYEQRDQWREQQMREGPQAERGAVFSGPDSGYKVPGLTLHGDEAIVPIDNNYTQGEPSAVDGKVRPVPGESMVPPMNINVNNTYETGTDGVSVSPIKMPDLMGDSSLQQPLVDAMALPTKIAGGMALASASELIKQISGDSPAVSSELSKVITPLATIFDLPEGLVNKAKGSDSLGKEGTIGSAAANATVKAEKNIFQKAFDGLKKLFGGGDDNDGGGDGVTQVTVQGPGGNLANNQAEVAEVMTSEFKSQGLSDEGARLALAEIGRENSLNKNLILGTHDDGGVKAYGAVSWQGGREKVLMDELRSRGIDPSEAGLAGSGDEGLKANAAAMIKEIAARGHTELLELLKKPDLTEAEKDRVRHLFKEEYFVYNKSIPLQRSRDWYDRVGGLNPTVQANQGDGRDGTLGAGTHGQLESMHYGPLERMSLPQLRSHPALDPSKTGASNPAVFKAAQAARKEGKAQGLTGDALEKKVLIASIRAKDSTVALAPPSPPPAPPEATEALRPVSAPERAQVALLNMGGERPVTAGTGAVPTPDQSTVAPSVSSLTKEVFTVDSVTT